MSALGASPAVPEVRNVFPWAESVVVAAISYLPPDRTISDDVPRGLIARVARGADYHVVLRAKLSCLSEIIKIDHPNVRMEVCVDTSPLPERKLAVLAGIAQRVKNANVFVEGCGSYAALGEIVTNIPIQCSPPTVIDPCGECDLCVRACPAQAIIAPGVIDRSRCLSALTQRGGVVAVELARAMGNRIYGCDTCQEACPQNANICPISPEFAEDVFPGATPELIPLIELTAKDFRERVSGSSIGWIRRARIRRNAAIAAGNMKCEQAIPSLRQMLEDENTVLREHAAIALNEIGC